MSGTTIISPNAVDTTLIEDGQPANSISPGDMRQLNDSLAGIASSQQAGTTYTFAAADRGTMIESTSSSATTFTVPPNSSVAFQIGSVVGFCQYGTGSLTIAAGAGVTLRTGTTLIIGAQYLSGSMRKRGTDEWIVTI